MSAAPDPMSHLAGVAGAGPGPGQPAASAPDPQPRAAGPTFRLRLLATSDIHSHLLSYDYFANRPQFGMGLAQTASLIARARAEVPNAVLLDNGDFLQGSALADLAAQSRGRRRPHPAIAAFNVLGYDAVSLGNHEFNYGLPALTDALAAAKFKTVSANIALKRGADPLQDQLLVLPYALIQRELTGSDGSRRQITLGILGLTPPEIMEWDQGHLSGKLEARPMIEAARAWLPEIRRAGADLVICLAHTGIGKPGRAVTNEAQAIQIAELDGVDVIVAGHTHEVFPNPEARSALHADPVLDAVEGHLAGKPAVQPGHSGSHLGVIDLDLRPASNGKGWILASSTVRAISASEVVAGMEPAQIRKGAEALRAAIGADHRATLAWTRQSIGRTEIPLTTHFALAADTQAMRLLAAAKLSYARRTLAGRPEAALPLLATVTPYRTGGRGGPLNYTDIEAGPLSMRHVFDLYPFPNRIVLSRTTFGQLIQRLEGGIGLYKQIVPGKRDQRLIDPMMAHHLLEMVPGLEYQIDLSRPRGAPGRITETRYQGRPVDLHAPLILVSNSFRQGTRSDMSGDRLVAVGPSVTSEIERHIRDASPIEAQLSPGWRFAPMPGTTVLFDSGAGAVTQWAEVAHLSPDLLGITEDGFHRFRLHL